MFYRNYPIGDYDDSIVVVSPEYDDVVDYDSYVPDSEVVRNFGLSGSGSLSTPRYDDNDDMPSDELVSIRSGKYDRTEVAAIVKRKVKDAKADVEKDKVDKAKKELEAIDKARQDYLDKSVGFDGAAAASTVT